MISMAEILGRLTIEDVSIDHGPNLYRLHYCVNYIRRLYGHPLTVTSGYRSRQEHQRIYREKGYSFGQIPWGSSHLTGAAIDIYDPEHALQVWICEHLEISELLDVYYEDFVDEHGNRRDWVHLQIFPPASQKRFFKP